MLPSPCCRATGIVSDISTVGVVEVFAACVLNLLILICYYVCSLLYLEHLFFLGIANVTLLYNMAACILCDHRWRTYSDVSYIQSDEAKYVSHAFVRFRLRWQYQLNSYQHLLERDAFAGTNRRAIDMMFVRPSVCLSGTGVHCDHTFSADLSLWLDSPMFLAPWHQSMPAVFFQFHLEDRWVWMHKLGE